MIDHFVLSDGTSEQYDYNGLVNRPESFPVGDGSITYSKLSDDAVSGVLGNVFWLKSNNEVLGKYGHYYVDGSSGSDSNDGTTQAKAFKTLEPVWSAVKNGDIEIRISLKGGSTYEWTPYNITSLAIHLASYGTGNVTINMPDDDIAFYNCHMKISGSSGSHIVFTGDDTIHFDGGSVYFEYAEIEQFRVYGTGTYCANSTLDATDINFANVYFGSCTLGGISGNSGVVKFASCTFDTAKKHPNLASEFIWIDNAVITIIGNTNIIIDNPYTSGSFLRVRGGTLSLLAGAQVTNEEGTLFANGLNLDASFLMSTTARADSFSYVGTNAYSTMNGGFTNLV